MKRKLFLSILIIFFTTSFMSLVGCNNQKPTKEQNLKQEQSSVSSSNPDNDRKVVYQLQESCGKRCDERFKKEFGNGIDNSGDGQTISSYQNHYNKKLNKCFILINSKNYPSNKEKGVFTNKTLYDVNENKEYGSFSKLYKQTIPSECYLLDKSCKYEGEWDILVKPYMEE